MRHALRSTFAAVCAACAGLAAASPALAQSELAADPAPDTQLSFTTGLDFSEGDYGAPLDTRILVVPFSARLKTGDVRITASVPWLRIDGANIVGGGAGTPIVIDPAAPRSVRSGLGDVSLGLAYVIPEDRLGIGIDLSGRIKLPTASAAKGLGTGKADFSGSVELSRTFGTVTPFASVGYRLPGDPDGFDLKNTLFASAGFSVAAGKTVLIASYDYRESPTTLAQDSHELFGAISVPVSSRLDITFYGSGGLSKGAPDYGVGAMLTLKAF